MKNNEVRKTSEDPLRFMTYDKSFKVLQQNIFPYPGFTHVLFEAVHVPTGQKCALALTAEDWRAEIDTRCLHPAIKRYSPGPGVEMCRKCGATLSQEPRGPRGVEGCPAVTLTPKGPDDPALPAWPRKVSEA